MSDKAPSRTEILARATLRAITHPAEQPKNYSQLDEREMRQLQRMRQALEGEFERAMHLTASLPDVVREAHMDSLATVIALAHAIGVGGRLTAAEHRRLMTNAARMAKLEAAVKPGSRQSVIETAIRENRGVKQMTTMLKRVNAALATAGHKRGIGEKQLYARRRKHSGSE
jgi:hypothetical protein